MKMEFIYIITLPFKSGGVLNLFLIHTLQVGIVGL